jgi:hypothetical protein
MVFDHLLGESVSEPDAAGLQARLAIPKLEPVAAWRQEPCASNIALQQKPPPPCYAPAHIERRKWRA